MTPFAHPAPGARRSPRRLRTRVGALAASLAMAAAALLALPTAAHAHDELLSTDPAAGSSVETAPSSISMTFSGNLFAQDGASEVQATDGTGASVVDGAAVVTDNVLTQPLSADATGTVTVLWRVVSSDGHPISGEFAFTVAAAPAPTPTATPTTTAGTPSPTAEATTEATAAPIATPAPDPASDTGPAPWIVGGAIVLAVAGGVLAFFLARSRRSGSAGPRTNGSTPSGEGPSGR